LLKYFGDPALESQCGGCDLCTGKRLAPPEKGAAKTPRGKKKPALPVGEYSELAATELREWRRELSKSLGVPAFVIFNDATLLGLAAVLPTDRESFLTVKGTGESRWERFGPKIVEISLLARAARVPSQRAL
jgi:ATP-dependent DNA helicase RecQ